jgi:hypothetical protein
MPVPLSLRGAHPDCGGCNFKAGGYSEGYSGYLNLFTILPLVAGRETVYDFATMERAKFEFHTMHVSEGSPFTGVSTGFLEGGISAAYVQLYDFKSWESIEADYSGRFDGYMVGANSTGLQGGAGYINVWSSDPATGQPGVSGAGLYLLLGVGVDTPLPPVSGSRFATFYTLEGNHQWYTTTGTETGIVSKSLMELMQQDIRSGNYLPMPFNWPGLNQATDVLGVVSRHIAANNLRQVWDMHTDYFTEYFSKCRAAAAK